jgi:hypothetical protein
MIKENNSQVLSPVPVRKNQRKEPFAMIGHWIVNRMMCPKIWYRASTHHPIMTKITMTEIQNGSVKCISGYWIFGNWNFFEILNLDTGI